MTRDGVAYGEQCLPQQPKKKVECSFKDNPNPDFHSERKESLKSHVQSSNSRSLLGIVDPGLELKGKTLTSFSAQAVVSAAQLLVRVTQRQDRTQPQPFVAL